MNRRAKRNEDSFSARRCLTCAACLLLAFGTPPGFAQDGAEVAAAPTHMSEGIRSGIDKVVVVAGLSPLSQSVTGTYDQATEGLIGGMESGAQIGTIRKDVGGIPVSIPIPILTIPGAIYGALTGAAKRRAQEFRDALTEELAKAENDSLSSNGLAQDVYFSLRELPHLSTKILAGTESLPEGTDAILFVGLNDIVIDVQGEDAILTTSARATLRRARDGWGLYENVVHYQDRDTLENWTENDSALWHDYSNYARHFIGREIAAEVFGKVALRRELHPVESANVDRVGRNVWQGVTRSTTPTLGWNLELLGGDDYGAWTESLTESDIFYDIEIYDSHRLVYAEYQLQGSSHTPGFELEDCQAYRWSVRPSYHVGDGIKFGKWMRMDEHSNAGPNGEFGLFGDAASAVPAYSRHFASLEIECSSR